MATMDILEDLLLDRRIHSGSRGRRRCSTTSLLIASLNRGGLAGSSWELDDPVTGPSPAACQAWRLDGDQAAATRGPCRRGVAKDDAGQRARHQRGQSRSRAAGVPGAAAGDHDGQGLCGGEDAGGAGAPGGRGVGAWRQQPVPVAEAAVLRRLRHGGALDHAADSAVGRRIGGRSGAVFGADESRARRRGEMCAARWWDGMCCIPGMPIRWRWRKRPGALSTKAGRWIRQ